MIFALESKIDEISNFLSDNEIHKKSFEHFMSCHEMNRSK